MNLDYPGLELVGIDPLILVVDDFCTATELELVREIAMLDMHQSTVTEAAAEAAGKTVRTSSSGSLPKWSVPWLTERVTQLTGYPAAHMESVQVTRYRSGERYSRHVDAVDLATADGRDWDANGGNRLVTVLVYMNDVASGGGTQFDTVTIVPQLGRAVVFFPSTTDGQPDVRTGHEALPPIDCEKWAMQVWVRQRPTDFE
jgi:prolyl 4-hydroxylase